MTKSLPKGHVSCLAQNFKYTPAVHTDLAKSFARVRRRLRERQTAEAEGKVRALLVRKAS